MQNDVPGFLIVGWGFWVFCMTPGILFLFVWNKLKGMSVLRSLWESTKIWGLTFIVLLAVSIHMNPRW